MSHSPHEPLSPEERALADRLARLGPHDGPSPALDARILAAAHAAVAPERSRRWFGLAAVPASLVTGVGMAAVLALAVGVVWQLRPDAPAPREARDEAGDMGYVSAEIIQRERKTPPPPPPPPEASAPMRALQAPAATTAAAPVRAQKAAPTAAAAATTAAPTPAPAPTNDRHYLDEAVGDHSGASHARAEAAAVPYAAPAAAPAPGAPAPVAAMSAPAAAEPAFAPPPAESRAALSRKAAADAEARRRDASEQAAAESDAASAQRQAAAKSAAASVAGAVAADSAAPAQSEATLDRVEVTGSRLRVQDLPVRSDAQLAPDQWIERIRARRDSGDIHGALESLARFRKAHPGVRIPDDLRTLAAPNAK